MAWTDSVNTVISDGGSFLWIALIVIVVGVIGLILLAFAIWWYWAKSRWNLKVEIKLVRADGQAITGEWGKGYFNAKKGVCFIKRPGFKSPKIPIKLFDIRRYLQGPDLMTVIQLGPEDYLPVLNKSWTEYQETMVNSETGEEKVVREAVINIQVDKGQNKAWKASWEAAAKNAYSLQRFFQQFQTPIAIGIVVVCCFIGFAVLRARIG